MNKSWLRQAIEDLEQDQAENYWQDQPVSDFGMTIQVIGLAIWIMATV